MNELLFAAVVLVAVVFVAWLGHTSWWTKRYQDLCWLAIIAFGDATAEMRRSRREGDFSDATIERVHRLNAEADALNDAQQAFYDNKPWWVP